MENVIWRFLSEYSLFTHIIVPEYDEQVTLMRMIFVET